MAATMCAASGEGMRVSSLSSQSDSRPGADSMASIGPVVSAACADANEAVAGSHKPLHLDIRALADTEPDEWLRELGRRKIDSLVVDDDDVFEMLSSI